MNKVTYIGIGASAGGLKELQNLLKHLTFNENTVYLIVQHLSTEHKSLLSDILAKSTAIPVLEAKHGMLLESGNIYVVQPNMFIDKSSDGLVIKKLLEKSTSPQPSIDAILSSLAEFEANNSVGVILSGSGRDGTKGLQAISDVGGITISQLPSEAEYSGMPQSAIEDNIIDIILPVKDIGKLLCGMISEDTHDKHRSLEAISIILHAHKQLNLAKYKKTTILRRISKRMMLLNIESLNDYIIYMIKNLEEAVLLHQNILIGVTKFFREKEAFDALSHTLEVLLQKEPQKEELRIWVTACSTGEEAYSIAIMISELLSKMSRTMIIVRIFASDIDDNALNIARKAVYTAESVHEIDSQLLSKYFQKKESHYHLSKEIREMVVLTHHDLLKDPPFIKMDIISCRNALIYFKSIIQQEIFAMFHYALQEKGILFLGISETASHHLHYFSAINSQWKLYQREHLNNPPKLPQRFYQNFPLKPTLDGSTSAQETYTNIDEAITESIYELLIPSCVVVNKHSELIFTKGKVPYLKFSEGFVSLNLYKNLHPLLHLEVRNIMSESSSTKRASTSKFVELTDISDTNVFVRVLASPFIYSQDEYVTLLYFQEIRSCEMIFESGKFNLPSESDIVISLETQLAQIKEQFHSLQNELDISRENMQMMNEELQSSNEELQSSNEELETSNEELQSSNEELNNTYYNIQLLEQKYLMILESTSESILGLDIEGKHTFVNSMAAKELGYSAEYLIGKHSHHIWHHTRKNGDSYPESECPITRVLQGGVQIRGEELFWRGDGTSFEVEFISNPIMEDEKITGAVVFFHDISKKKELERSIKYEQETMKRYLDVAGVMVVVLNKNADIELINKKGSEILGAKIDDIVGKNWFEHYIEQDKREELESVFEAVINDKKNIISTHTNEIVTTNGKKRLIYWHNTILRDENKNVTGVITTGSDITDEHIIQDLLIRSEEKYALTFSEANIGMAHRSLEGNWLKVNRYLCNITGYSEKELLEMNYKDITYEEDLEKDRYFIEKTLSGKFPSYRMEKRYIRKDGSILWVNQSVALIRDKDGEAQYFISVIEDISDVKQMAEQLREKEEIMIAQSRQAAMGDMIAMIAHQWRQPISVISMAANNLRADIELEAKIETQQLNELINTVSYQTNYLSRTIDDFRNFFKPDRAKERTTMCTVVEGALSVVQKSLNNNGIEVVYENRCEKKVNIYTNEMIQVLLNLINNAKDAIVESKITQGRITITVQEMSEFVEIQVCDNGLGIKESMINRLGEPYLSSKGKNGTGLGLYMSITIIKKHFNGTIEWENLERGACFRVKIPVES